jgi:hypothetical protein
MQTIGITLCAMLLAACIGGPPDNPKRRAEAAELAERYLAAVAGAEADRGWSLLTDSARAEWASEAAWVASLEAAHWSGFDVSVIEVISCDDGYICPVALQVSNGPASVPLLDGAPRHHRTLGIRFRSDEGAAGNAEITVVLPDLLRGPGGVAPPPG